jgi:hypothetical protein
MTISKLLLVAMLALTNTAFASDEANVENVELKSYIESSKQFRRIMVQDARQGITTTCKNYKAAASVDLQSKAKNTTMVIEIVTAECISLPADFPVEQKLVSLVTRTSDSALNKTELRVESVKIIPTHFGLDYDVSLDN